MKWTLFVIMIVALVSSQRYGPPSRMVMPLPPQPIEKKEESGPPTQQSYRDDISHKLKAGNHDIYLIVFYHPGENSQHLGSLNRKLIDKLENDFLFKNDIKDLYYTTIDASKPTYEDLLRELDIDTDDLLSKPALFIMEHGNGFIMTGPRAIDEMKTNLNELLDNRDHGY